VAFAEVYKMRGDDIIDVDADPRVIRPHRSGPP
jgi:hypothetical protein